jgi:hypothetical protein
LSLGAKMLLSFGGVVVLACGMALLWGFVQYKNLATEAVARQAHLGLAWVQSEVQAVAAIGATSRRRRRWSPTTLRDISARNPEASAVVYYVDDSEPADDGGRRSAAGRWARRPCRGTRRRTSRAPRAGLLSIGPAGLAGRSERLRVRWHDRDVDLGAVAVLYPNYRGRGESMVQPLRELLGVLRRAVRGVRRHRAGDRRRSSSARSAASSSAPTRWPAASWPIRSPPAATATRSGA